MKKISIIGIGRWGKNLIREFSKISDVVSCYYKGNQETTAWLKKYYPRIKIAKSYKEILYDKNIEGIVVATPIKTHYEIASRALLANKHCFVEKPMTDDFNQAKKLVKLAKEKNLILFIGHIFLYHLIFKKLKELTQKDPIQFADFYWGKWGHFTEDIIWNLACHEVSIAIDLMGQPEKVSVISTAKTITNGDLVALKLKFPGEKIATMNINRLSPEKRKTVTLLTKNNLFVWDNDSLYKLDRKNKELKLTYRSETAPLTTECKAFIKSIKTKKEPATNGEFGLKVVSILARL